MAFDFKKEYRDLYQPKTKPSLIEVPPIRFLAVEGSGGAATGSVAIYRIAPDGFSTDLIEIMDYEYQDENKVTYTPELGNMSPQEFEQGDYLRGFDVPLYFKLFAGKRDQN